MKENKNYKKVETIDRPPLCCIDLDTTSVMILKEKGYEITRGSLGPKININRNYGYDVNIYYKNVLPQNIQEFEIIMIDLANISSEKQTDIDFFNKEQYDQNQEYFISSQPATSFDLRPISVDILQHSFNDIIPRIILVFTSPYYEIEYKTNKNYFFDYSDSMKKSNYPFIQRHNILKSKMGTKVTLASETEILSIMFKSFLKDIKYNQTFRSYENHEQQNSLLPLLKNKAGENVSVVLHDKDDYIFFIPQLEKKGDFIVNFLENVAPNLLPELFPNMTNKNWLKDNSYYLPQQLELLQEKEAIENDFKKKLDIVEKKIIELNKEYSFLHDMITESDDPLVDAVMVFLNWLEFSDVRNADAERVEGGNEEDITVIYKEYKLLIECKGIGGTSKDKECSQIDKVVMRRLREKKVQEVHGIYIVNHQRQKPPLQRDNPPFKPQQIEDAESAQRGMLSTWQLFNLYFDIQNGVITKKEARECFLQSGLIQFESDNSKLTGIVKKIYKDIHVYSVELRGKEITREDFLFYKHNQRFIKLKIVSIQQNKTTLSSVSEGVVGIKFSESDLYGLKVGAELFKLEV